MPRRDDEFTRAYINRGLAKKELGDLEGAVKDKLKAEELEKKQEKQ